MGETSSRSELTTPKIVALIALLIVFAEGVNRFWIGLALINAGDTVNGGAQLAVGILQVFIMAGLLMIALIATIVDLKIEILKKLYHWLILLLIGLFTLLLELSGENWDGVIAWRTAAILGGLLVLIAAGLELAAAKKDNLSPAKLVGLAGLICALIDVILMIVSASAIIQAGGTPSNNAIYYIVVVIICIVLLCAVLQNKINVKLTFSWWLILIIGFIFYTWVNTLTGTIILIAFIIMIKE